MNNTINDLASITTLREFTLRNILKKLNIIISDSVLENYESQETLSSFDLEFGTLQVLVDRDCIKYKFIPSSALEEMLVETLETKKSPLVGKLEEVIQEKITSTYKDLL